MSSFLFNTAIILLMAPPILQFCATAFAVYGHNSDIFDIFGNQVMYLQGISWLYTYNVGACDDGYW
jgi:LMBR1 domain-containing protein 1